MTGESRVRQARAVYGAAVRPGCVRITAGTPSSSALASRAAGRTHASDFYERVTVLDRDVLPSGIGQSRHAVPQDRHIHGMQPAGQLALEALFPGFGSEARAAGAPPLAFGLEMRFRLNGHLLARVDLPGAYCLTSRTLLESLVRRRVRALANVTLGERCNVLGLVDDGPCVIGVLAQGRAGQAGEVAARRSRGRRIRPRREGAPSATPCATSTRSTTKGCRSPPSRPWRCSAR